MRLSERIKQQRTAVQHLTLQQVAQRTGLSVSYLSDIENGRTIPTIATLCTISKIGLRLSLLDLLTGVDFAGEYTGVETTAPHSLVNLIDELNIPEDWAELLAGIYLRGKSPQTREDWLLVYLTLKKVLEVE
jgi:transcriptional regulator with XRE-family HTH domain